MGGAGSTATCASALYLADDQTEVLMVQCDGGALGGEACLRLQSELAELTSIPPAHVFVLQSCCGRREAPGADQPQLFMHMIAACIQARRASQPARLGVGMVHLREPGSLQGAFAGMMDAQVSVVAIRTGDGRKFLAAMTIGALLPVSLEDAGAGASTGVADNIREYLRANVLGLECPMLVGVVPTAPTDVPGGVCDLEALGLMVAQTVEPMLSGLDCTNEVQIGVRLERVVEPALGAGLEMRVLGLGAWQLAAWPDGVSIRCTTALREQLPGAQVLSLANRVPADYIVTPESPAGRALVETTVRLLSGNPLTGTR